MARLKVYGIARTRAFRVLWMAEELGLDYEHIAIETGAAGARQPGYLAVNPNGRLPAIDDDGFIMWESLAINIYLAKKHATGTLYPTTPHGEAKVVQWSLWAANEIERATNVWSFHAERLPPAERDPKIAAAAIELLTPPFRVLDRALADRPYLLGDEFTVADLNVAAVALRSIAMDLSATPHYRDWLRRCYDRPAAQKVSRMRREAEADASIDTVREAAKRNRL
ncbi:MAG TPA: glutathione S-transferase family protein [Stellaceae bacterium]|nr:glutathione S-transferase family protein [Stellaceae bacterium]